MPNNLGGLGEIHFGILKKPTGNVSDATKEGYQESGIREGVGFGGVFLEEGGLECVRKG